MSCILQDMRSDRCSGCDGMCSHKIIVEGFTGNGGLVAKAGIPEQYKGVTPLTSPVRADKGDLYKFVDDYVQSLRESIKTGERPRSLYLYSKSPGTGKSTTAVAMLNAYIGFNYLWKVQNGSQPTGDEAYFLDVNELQTLYNKFNRPMIPEDVARGSAREYYRRLQKAQEAEFAVLDDIGVRDTTEGFTGDLHMLINKRMVDEKPTVYTSNIQMKDLATLFTQRFYDRIKEQTVEVPFHGGSYRGL